MGTVTKLNDVLCANISKVDDILKANASKWDDNTFCPGGSPTPTPTPTSTPVTPTPTPTPTATPCTPGCCSKELCYSVNDCGQACSCAEPAVYYISLTCDTDPCTLANALGIFTESSCREAANFGYYSDGGVDCYYWDGVYSVSYQGPC